jgi:hypothetical protein
MLQFHYLFSVMRDVLMNLNDLLKGCVIGIFCVFSQKLYKMNEYETCEESYKLRLD